MHYYMIYKKVYEKVVLVPLYCVIWSHLPVKNRILTS